MAHFPIFIDLQDKTVLIVGQGKETQAKADRLRPYGPQIRFLSELTAEDLDPAPALVILAGGDRTAWAGLCMERNIPVNSVDDIPNCSFYFPSLVQRGDLSIGICTSGAAPVVSVLLRKQIEQGLPSHLAQILPWLTEQTQVIRQEVPDYDRRAQLLRAISAAAFERNRPLTAEELTELKK